MTITANLPDQERMRQLDWKHIIEIAPGISTPGKWDGAHIRRFLDSTQFDFEGKKVLDVGCFDGLWSFEAEKRGARQVWAVDDLSKRPGDDSAFQFAHEALNSEVKYNPHLTVYRLEDLGQRDFDVVLFLGLIYHLVHPMFALAMARRVLTDGGKIVIESDVIDDERESYATFHYRNHHFGDRSNWFIPTTRCLLEMLESCYFEIERFDVRTSPRSTIKTAVKRLLGRKDHRIGRICVLARAVRREDSNWIRPDELLYEFDDRWRDLEAPETIKI